MLEELGEQVIEDHGWFLFLANMVFVLRIHGCVLHCVYLMNFNAELLYVSFPKGNGLDNTWLPK
jgi:hypothetical protein